MAVTVKQGHCGKVRSVPEKHLETRRLWPPSPHISAGLLPQKEGPVLFSETHRRRGAGQAALASEPPGLCSSGVIPLTLIPPRAESRASEGWVLSSSSRLHSFLSHVLAQHSRALGRGESWTEWVVCCKGKIQKVRSFLSNP